MIMPALSNQEQMDYLQKVSRTFALTIPMLRKELGDVISNAYLHFRIIDTVEDEIIDDDSDKIDLLRTMGSFYQGDSQDLGELDGLKERILKLINHDQSRAEYRLIGDYIRLCKRTIGYGPDVYKDIFRCASIMSNGMASSIERGQNRSQNDVDHYCYFVAGVVGQLLARFFSAGIKDPEKAREVFYLSVSFGEGLQLVNILKDRFTDKNRGSYFLPYDGQDIDDDEVVDKYVRICMGHLDNAVRLISLLGKKQGDIRLFCLINVAMAYATLYKIYRHRMPPKINRHQVWRLLAASRICAQSNTLLFIFKRYLSRNLPSMSVDFRELSDRVSLWKD